MHDAVIRQGVLCAIRDVADDEHVARTAAGLARALDRPLTLVHIRRPLTAAIVDAAGGGTVLPPAVPPGAVLPGPSAPDLVGLADTLDAAGRTIDVAVLDGEPTELLLRLGRRRDAMWLVVGDGGQRPLAAALLGGTTRRLLAEAGCPLLVVPRAGEGPPREPGVPVACLVDDDAHAAAVCELGAGLAQAAGTDVLLIHAAEDPVADAWRDATTLALMQRCADAVAARGVSVRMRLATGERADALLATCRAAGARPLVMGGAEHGALSAALRAATTHRLVSTSYAPVAVARPPSPAVAAPGHTV